MFTECTLSALERVGWGDGESIFTSDDSGLEEICIIFWLRQCILNLALLELYRESIRESLRFDLISFAFSVLSCRTIYLIPCLESDLL